MTKLEATLKQFANALQRFKEVLSMDKTDIVRDSAIKRFEFTFDICWKTLKTFLESEKGIVCNSPKDCFREAYHQKIIAYDESWLKIVDMRNEAVHSYDEEIAERIYLQLPIVLKNFENLFIIINKPLT